MKNKLIFTGERFVPGQASFQTEREHLDRYLFAKKYVRGKTVLDIACGTGYGSKLLFSNHPSKIYGVDISKEAIEFAKKNDESKMIIYKVCDGTNLKCFMSKSVDIVISFETIEHIENYKSFIKETYRVLKDGGVLLISTPNKKYSSPNSLKPINPFHFIEFYPSEFKKILMELFHDVELYGQEKQTFFIILRRLVFSFIPQKIKDILFPVNVRNSIYVKQKFNGINRNDFQNSKYILAFCKK